MREISLDACGELLRLGCLFNDEIHKLPTGNTTHIKKGVYFFKTHEEANKHQEDSIIEGMVRIARERANGKS